MLELVVATRFTRKMTSGRTSPFLMECERTNGDKVELVAKFQHPTHLPALGLAREATAAMLAADLGLPVPEPFIVIVEDDLAQVIKHLDAEAAARLKVGAKKGFGSALLPTGYSVWPSSKAIQPEMAQSALEIFAFDMLIQNSDRRTSNPNLLHKGTDFAIIDHELSLMVEDQTLFWRPSWENECLTILNLADNHVLKPNISSLNGDLGALRDRWAAISITRYAEYANSLPPEWRTDAFAGISKYLVDLSNNLDAAFDEVKRVLM